MQHIRPRGQSPRPPADSASTGSVGAIAVALSNPDILHVGSGEGLQRPDLSVGDGIYKSTDAGRTWRHLGLRDGQQIARVVVDPGDASRVFAAVLGHPYGPNEERGVFRSTGGPRAFDPADPQTLCAVLWAARQAPWENGWSLSANNGLSKSIDGARWANVTPPALTPWSKVSLMEASHFDTLAAYAAINRFRLDDIAPHPSSGGT